MSQEELMKKSLEKFPSRVTWNEFPAGVLAEMGKATSRNYSGIAPKYSSTIPYRVHLAISEFYHLFLNQSHHELRESATALCKS